MSIRHAKCFTFALLPASIGLVGYAMAGDLTDRCTLTLERVLHGTNPQYTADLVLADAIPRHERRFAEFSGDVSGRYIEALSMVAKTSGRDIPELHQVVRQLLPMQKPDGHFGDAVSETEIRNQEMAILWGNGRLLVGLLTYHELTKDAATLASARKLGDFIVTMAPRLNRDDIQADFSKGKFYLGYICWTQCVEGLSMLARTTGDARYRAVAADIAARTVRSPSQHSHGFVTSLRGILDLHHLTGDARFLTQAENEWQGIVDSGNLLPQGALPESFAPAIERDEGCSEADWLRFCLGLWHTTGKTKYLEAAELCWFNEFSFNQFPTGDFGHNTFTADGAGMPSAQAWWCCTFHGLRTFPDVTASAFSKTEDDVTYHLPVDGSLTTDGLTIEANSHLGDDGNVDIRITKSDDQIHTLVVRVPRWADSITVDSDGGQLGSAKDATSLNIKRIWKSGDHLRLHYILKTQTIHPPANPKKTGFWVGPWLVGSCHEREPGYCNEPNEDNFLILPKTTHENNGLDPDVESEHGKLQAPYAHRRVRFQHGGYPMQPSWMTLRPIAERTAGTTQDSWSFWFATEGKTK